MAALKHHLALDIPDTSCENIIRIMDASVYAPGLDVDCPRLDITLPGFSVPVYYTDNMSTQPWSLTLNAVDLGLTPPNTPNPVALPDGLYTIRYSVSPNDKVYVTYYHLRVTKLLNEYYQEICKVQLTPCEPSPEQHEKMHDLRYIKMYIDGAKAKAEYCHAPHDAVEMYKYAQKLLKKYKTGCCITCK